MDNWEKKKYWIWLSLIPNLENKKKQSLLYEFKDPEIIYYLKEKELSQVTGLGEKTIFNILNQDIRDSTEKHLRYIKENEIDIISIYDEDYPQILKQIYDFPISIYCKGDKTILNHKSIGIVGCREASEYGKNSAKYFSYHLIQKGINIVSGLAKGVDSYAHIGAICGQIESYTQSKKSGKFKKCGKTIAILGNGLDIMYPKENLLLAKQIIEKGGAILSEYPFGTKPERMNFLARNRIISGMSNGVLVIEAKEKSGTLLTVDFAIEQGRDVFAVPGNINCLNSVGTNQLIQQGAKLVTNYKDILGEFL